MQTWIYFVLISHGIWSFTSFIDKVVISKGYIKSPLVYIVLNGAMNVFLIFLLPFVGFEPLSFLDLLIVFVSGIMFVAAVTLYYKAVQYDEISRVIIINQISPVFVLILSFFLLGEVLTKNYFIGFLFLLIAGIVVSYNKIEGKFRLSKAFYFMFLAAIFGSIAAVAAKYILSITAFWNAFLWFRLANSTAVFVLTVPSIRNEFSRTFKQMPNKIRSLLGFKMIIDFSAFIFSGLAILNGPVSLVTALSSSVQPVIVFIITLFTSVYLPKIVKEEINKKAIFTKLLAIALIIIGIVFINL